MDLATRGILEGWVETEGYGRGLVVQCRSLGILPFFLPIQWERTLLLFSQHNREMIEVSRSDKIYCCCETDSHPHACLLSVSFTIGKRGYVQCQHHSKHSNFNAMPSIVNAEAHSRMAKFLQQSISRTKHDMTLFYDDCSYCTTHTIKTTLRR